MRINLNLVDIEYTYVHEKAQTYMIDWREYVMKLATYIRVKEKKTMLCLMSTRPNTPRPISALASCLFEKFKT